MIGLVLLFIALPDGWKVWAPGILRAPTFHFGLDLVGGTQLDFRISEQEMNDQIARLEAEIAQLKDQGAGSEKIAILQNQLQSTKQQQTSIVESIRTVLERRINALGVSEAVITPSYMGDEKHLLVECPGVVDTQQCIATVGKTIQLEFKEEFTEPTAEFEQSIRDRATAALRRITVSGALLPLVGQDLGSTLGVAYSDRQWFFKKDLPKGLEDLWTTPVGKVLKREGSITVPEQDENGQTTEKTIPGIWLAEAVSPRTQTGRLVQEAPTAFGILAKEHKLTYTPHTEVPLDAKVEPAIAGILQSMTPGDLQTVSLGNDAAALLFLRLRTPGQEQMAASHILIAFKGAAAVGESVTRTKEEALTLAKDIKSQLDNGADFATLAKKYSDDGSGKSGGSLGTFVRGAMVAPFEQAAFALPQGGLSDPVETQFGYHVIRADRAVSRSFDVASYDELRFTGPDAKTQADAAMADLKAGKVQQVEDALAVRSIFFSLLPTGWKDTTLTGKHFRSAAVTLDSTTNLPVVQIAFDDEGAKLFQELTKNNVGKRIAIFVGGDLVSAPRVQTEIAGGTAIITGSGNFEEAQKLAQDLNTGAIPAPIYLAGQHTIEATLGGEALRTSLKAALVGIIILMIYMIVLYRFLGLLADAALMGYAILFVVILKLPLFFFSSQYIVLTVAGMAGIILSLGMAVDANVLIFERIKEELRKGKLVTTAVEIGFKRAWPSIRDGNASTLLTCAILFVIGTSIVRGFSVTLGMGVLMSMFTAITVTRWLIRKTSHLPFAKNSRLLVGIRSAHTSLS
ncbi:MAG: protein translocase subunit SecD [Candidatus Peribacteraceae bacterium]|nr:protein translocase subunit SecD [Candidatus Peribacteraceae bacterium]MDD5742278.1 protein translocase subunit SecD [Candidatus Peribacteraceae bacterium]